MVIYENHAQLKPQNPNTKSQGPQAASAPSSFGTPGLVLSNRPAFDLPLGSAVDHALCGHWKLPGAAKWRVWIVVIENSLEYVSEWKELNLPNSLTTSGFLKIKQIESKIMSSSHRYFFGVETRTSGSFCLSKPRGRPSPLFPYISTRRTWRPPPWVPSSFQVLSICWWEQVSTYHLQMQQPCYSRVWCRYKRHGLMG